MDLPNDFNPNDKSFNTPKFLAPAAVATFRLAANLRVCSDDANTAKRYIPYIEITTFIISAIACQFDTNILATFKPPFNRSS